MEAVKALRIKDWSDNFEVAQSRKYERLSWVPFPIKLDGDGFRVLMADRDGQAAYGVFCALALLAAAMPCRGLLADAQGALSVRSICAKTGIQADDFERARKFMDDHQVHWLQEVSESHARRLVAEARARFARSRLGANSDLEQEQETATEQELEIARKRESSAGGFASAAAASPIREVQSALRGLWKRQTDKADRLAILPGATPERVQWLMWRARTENAKRPHGFIEKGIREQWTIDGEWLGRYQAQRAALNRNGNAARPVAANG